MNRRNVLTGLGGLAISGGALFSTGAFTSVSAEREVEVNVLGGQNGIVGGNTTDGNQEDIADSITDGAVDVLVDLSSDSIAVRTDNGLVTDGSELYPSPNNVTTVYTDSDDSNNSPFEDKATEQQHVSLVANDVSIVFGSDVGLPRSSDITYEELFAFADPNSNNPDVYFDTPTTDPDLLTEVGDSDLTSSSSVSSEASNGGTVKAKVATGTTDGATEQLDIGIGEDPA
jgi:hypothetical protein